MRLFLVVLLSFFISANLNALELGGDTSTNLSSKSKVFGVTVPTTMYLFSFAPEIIDGWNTPLFETEKKYIASKYYNLPILGGFYSNAYLLDKEVLLSRHIDLAIGLNLTPLMNENLSKILRDVKIPYLTINVKKMNEYADFYEELGRLFNMKERASKLSTYVREAIAEVENAVKKVDKRKKVYLALGNNGLNTRCSPKDGSDIIDIAGGENVYACSTSTASRVDINMEELYNLNPEYIIVSRKSFYRQIYSDKKWSKLKAVKKKQVILLPNEEPYSWLDKNTIMQFFAIKFVAAKLYPELYEKDLALEAQKFLKLFLNYDMSIEEAQGYVEPEKSLGDDNRFLQNKRFMN